VAALLLVRAGLATHAASATEPAPYPTPNEQGAVSDGLVAFDIPPQSLASALHAYSIAAHREVVYNGELALGRQAAGVKGFFTPETALQQLLEGTGLVPRYMAADAFVLVAEDHPLAPVNTAPRDAVMRYYGRIQASLKQAFCLDKRTQPGDYHVAVGFRIGPSGTISRAELLGSTGNRDLDALVANTIRGLAIGTPPPEGFAQPVILMVTPQAQAAMRDCDVTDVQSDKDVR